MGATRYHGNHDQDPAPTAQHFRAMNTNASSPSTEVTTCRKCGEVFSRALSACPACGASRHRRHKSHSGRHASDTWQLWLQKVRVFVLRKKYYFIYILLGVFAGAILRPIVMFLAEFSMPEGWRHARALGMQPFSLQHVVEPFIAAGQTLGRWTIQGVVGAVTWVYETVANLIVMYPSAMVMAVIGAAIGFWMARRRHKRRSRLRQP